MKDKTPTNIEDFNIVDPSEKGINITLCLPDGTETEHFLTVRGADSPTFRKAQARNNRERLALLKVKDKAKEMDAADRAMRESGLQDQLVASLVADWSFPQECTIENVAAFFAKSPQIREQVDLFAGERANFFNKPSTD